MEGNQGRVKIVIDSKIADLMKNVMESLWSVDYLVKYMCRLGKGIPKCDFMEQM